MAKCDPRPRYNTLDQRIDELEAENIRLRAEIRVGHEAAELTAQLVIQQFERNESIMGDLRAASEGLQAANEHLRELDKMKSDFLSSVSHELRTPLTSIRGFAKLVGRDFERAFQGLTEADPKLARKATRILDNLEIILSESERLTRLINDVLDLAKIESGNMSWKDEQVELPELIRQALNAAQGQFDAKAEVALIADIAPDLPPVIADRDRLIQVLVNLLNNAAKFTVQGTVTLRAEADAGGWVRLLVIDTGIGFPPAEAESLFDKFKQSSQGDTMTDKPKGTGLGLSICREILRHYNGNVTATSAPGVGSTFTVTLPAATGADDEASEAALLEETGIVDLSAPLILVVDDDPAVCRYLTQLFQENRYRVITAENGKIALEKARQYPPQLITMDLAMPVMDGHLAIAALRADPQLHAIPVVVLTAMPNREATGANVAFGKPIDEGKLLSGVRLLLGGQRSQGGAGDDGGKIRCLVVHDTGGPLTEVPVFCGPYEHCPIEQLGDWVASGYKGVVVAPFLLLEKIDLEALQANSDNQVVILPIGDHASQEVAL